MMSCHQPRTKANKTDAGNGSNGICRVIDASRSPSPDPKRSPNLKDSTSSSVILTAMKTQIPLLAAVLVLAFSALAFIVVAHAEPQTSYPCKKCKCKGFDSGANSVTCKCGHATDAHGLPF